MYWLHIGAGDRGLTVRCSVCGKDQNDIIYVPQEMSERQADRIQKLFGVDPYEDFLVCEECMDGHCGAVPGRNANNWLEKQEAKQP